MNPNIIQMKLNELDQFTKIVEEQTKNAIQKNKAKQRRKDKIEKILGQTVQKLKIQTIDMNKRFQQRFFKELSTLKTFVNAQNQLQQLNVLRDETLLKKIDQAKKNKDLYEMDDQKIIHQLKKDQLSSDINISQEMREKQEEYLRMMHHKRMVSVQSLKTLEMEEKDEIFELIDDKIKENREKYEFRYPARQDTFLYDQIRPMQSIHYHSQERKENKANENQAHLNRLVENLKTQYGIDLEKDHYLGERQVYEKYLENSKKVLRRIKHSSLERLQEGEGETNLRDRIMEQRRIREKKYFRKQIRAHESYGRWNNVEKKGSVGAEQKQEGGKKASHHVGLKESYQQRKMRAREMNLIYTSLNSIQARIREVDSKKELKKSSRKLRWMEDEMEMLGKKHDMNQKLVKLGFSSHDANLNLKRDLKQNITLASKNLRKLKIIKYY